MTNFDQRNQQVSGNQHNYNIAGDFNFGTIQSKFDIPTELHKLISEVGKATQSGALNPETAVDLEAKIKKAIVETQKPEPDPQAVIGHLDGAKALIEGMASAAGLVTVLAQAAEAIRRLFFP